MVAEAALERLEQRTAGRRAGVSRSLRRGPGCRTSFPCPRKRGRTLATLNFARIASVDAGEQRLGQIIERFLPEMIDDELGHAAVGRTFSGRRKQLEAHADFRAPAQQRRTSPWASPWWARSS